MAILFFIHGYNNKFTAVEKKHWKENDIETSITYSEKRISFYLFEYELNIKIKRYELNR